MPVDFLVSGDVQISDDQCIEENGAVTLTCTVGSLQNSVDWYFKAEQKVSCSNLADLCVPVAGTEDNRYTFSSVIANGQFTFKIDPASKNTDVGDYQCKHGSESKTVALAGCGKFPYISIFMYIQI